MVSLAWRSTKVLWLAWNLRRQYRQAEREGDAARAAGDDVLEDAVWDDFHMRVSRQICRQMVALQGVWIKLGQFLSTRADVLPDAWVEQLQTLQDAVPRESWRKTSQTLGECMGQSGLAAFLHIDSEPLACASIASVYRATLLGDDGKQAVVIKVQRRGIRGIIESDLRNLRFLVRRAAKEDAKFDYCAMIDEWADETLRELDFVNEAHNTELVGHNLRGVSGVKVPRVIRATGVTPTSRSLVLEYIEGERLTLPGAIARRSPTALVEALSASFAQQIFVDGVFNADPHPGNLMVESATGRLVLLDFGMTKRVDERQRIAFARLLLSAAEGDYSGLLLSLREMGLDASIGKPEEAMGAMRYLLRGSLDAEAREEADADARARHAAAARRDVNSRHAKARASSKASRSSDGGLASREVVPSAKGGAAEGGGRYRVHVTPSSVLFLLKVISCLRGMATSLGVGHSYLEAMRPYATRALREALSLEDKAESCGGGDGGLARRQHQSDEVYVAPMAVGPLQDSLRSLLRDLCTSGITLGASVCVYHEGALLANVWAGELGTLDPRPVRADSLYSAFSCGKGVLSLLTHVLIHKGYLRLDERVDAFWPAFGKHGKSAVTVRHVLEHRAGLSSYMPAGATVSMLLDYEAMTEGLESAPQTEASGDHAPPHYHALSFGWIVGGMLQRAVARKLGGPLPTFASLLDEHVARPLRLEGQIFAGLPPEGSEMARRFAVYERLTACTIQSRTGPAAADEDLFGNVADSSLGDGGMGLDPRLFNDLCVRTANLPAANMHMTAHALATIYSALAGGAPAARLLPPAYCEMLHREARAQARSRWPLGFGTYASESRACGLGHNGLWNSCGLSMHEQRGGLAVAVLVNTYTETAEAATRVLNLVFRSRGYGGLAAHSLGGVSFGE